MGVCSYIVGEYSAAPHSGDGPAAHLDQFTPFTRDWGRPKCGLYVAGKEKALPPLDIHLVSRP